ncbi:hypothetical protein PGTUg99_015093 [Puccinia graminis f. sp. tritici]|uniref:Uncharacterized protein n=1 Tax=Puccinia graminis f. sp. tritici TaxID=56615 RepID=A0A5B0RI18_PUCGR|nr:hypothetical protein PGTUg99_015093 [Puccinia graminis f. sp. tritici]
MYYQLWMNEQHRPAHAAPEEVSYDTDKPSDPVPPFQIILDEDLTFFEFGMIAIHQLTLSRRKTIDRGKRPVDVVVLLKMDRPADGQEHEPERFEYPDCDSNSDPADHIPPNPNGSPAPLIL